MIAFEGLLVGPAKAAGIKVPDDPEEYDPSEFQHFHVRSEERRVGKE